MELTNIQIGYRRDSQIEEAVFRRGCLTTEQVRLMFFRKQKYGARIACRRLESLTKAGRLQRVKPSFSLQYHYFMDDRRQLEHRAGVNWARLWLENGNDMESWERMTRFDYEQDYGILRTDGLVTIKNTATGRHRFLFVEFDRSGTFDKVEKYNAFYESGDYMNLWWAKLADRFPGIVVVCANTMRLRGAQACVEKRNIHKLRFTLILLDNLRKEVEL